MVLTSPSSHVGAGPLADARAAGVGQHRRADALEVGQQAVALDGGPHLLAARGDHELGLAAAGPAAAAWRAMLAARVMSS